LLFLAITGHQQQKKHDEQIPGIKFLGKKLPQESGNAGILPAGRGTANRSLRMHRRRRGWFFWALLLHRRRRCRWLWWRGRFLRRWGRCGFLHPVAAVGTVRLGDITVIHRTHLPALNWALPRNAVAMLAILAARMAFSSLAIRWGLK